MKKTVIKNMCRLHIYIGLPLIVLIEAMAFRTLFTISLPIITFLVLFLQNEWIKITNYKLEHENLPVDYNGFKVLQISDLHNRRFGRNQKKIWKKLEKIEADIIVVTGDTLEENYDRWSRILIEMLVKKAPTYYVTGNHDYDVCHIFYHKFEKFMIEKGVHILKNECTGLGCMKIIGIDDHKLEGKELFKERVDELGKEEGFKILLSHRPEFAKEYSNAGYDVVFAGHAHGGQVRIPFIGGLGAPGQILPRYLEGIKTIGDTKMVISRGLGDSLVTQRFFNRPEIVVTELIAK